MSILLAASRMFERCSKSWPHTDWWRSKSGDAALATCCQMSRPPATAGRTRARKVNLHRMGEARVPRIWRRWRELGTADRLIICEAIGLLAFAGLGLRILSFSMIRQLLSGLRSQREAFEVQDRGPASLCGSAGRVSWAVMAAGLRLPGTTCLARALVADTILRWRGCRAQMYIGVKERRPNGPIEAHAWVECDGVVVMGALPDLGEYHVLSEPARLERAERVQVRR
jgi:hypothetical protein